MKRGDTPEPTQEQREAALQWLRYGRSPLPSDYPDGQKHLGTEVDSLARLLACREAAAHERGVNDQKAAAVASTKKLVQDTIQDALAAARRQGREQMRERAAAIINAALQHSAVSCTRARENGRETVALCRGAEVEALDRTLGGVLSLPLDGEPKA